MKDFIKKNWLELWVALVLLVSVFFFVLTSCEVLDLVRHGKALLAEF